ncbi:hypothetical protein AAAT30_008900 [Segatella sinensis]
MKSADKKGSTYFFADLKSAETGIILPFYGYFFVLAPLLEADCKSEIGNWRRIANPPKLVRGEINLR